ncbi:MAG TPA: hypothetical protein VHV08_03820 [Pirellulales bacterium]|nr:hypothetical protein [Pirellulales bacterium]
MKTMPPRYRAALMTLLLCMAGGWTGRNVRGGDGLKTLFVMNADGTEVRKVVGGCNLVPRRL